MAETNASGAQQPPPPPPGGGSGGGSTFGSGGGSDQQSQQGSQYSGRGGGRRGGRGGRRNNNQGNYPSTRSSTKFKGKCDELANHVYDIADTGENKELFATTTREIAEYVARTYDNASEFRLGLVNTELETIVAPEALNKKSIHTVPQKQSLSALTTHCQPSYG